MATTTRTAFAVVQALLGIHRDVTAGLGVALAAHGASIDQWRVMRSLTESGRAMGDLTRALNIPPASLTRVVDSLATDALAYRRPDPADGRLVVIHLSTLGRSRLAVLDDAAAGWLAAVRDRLGQAGLDQLEFAVDTAHRALSVTALP